MFHLAASLGSNSASSQSINVDTTENLVQMAAEAGVTRFVHVSTVGVYDMKNLSEVDESAPLAINHPSAYPRTKAKAEVQARLMAEKHGIELSIVRPSMIYGPGYGIWSTSMYKNILENKPVYIGNGSAHFNPIFIDDVIDAILLCAKEQNSIWRSV